MSRIMVAQQTRRVAEFAPCRRAVQLSQLDAWFVAARLVMRVVLPDFLLDIVK
jgi:hypothetical protein